MSSIDMNSIKFRITNITCDACVKLSSKALEKLPGVIKLNIDGESGQVELVATESIDINVIADALKKVGKEISIN